MNLRKFARERLNGVLTQAGFELRPFKPDCQYTLGDDLEQLRQERVASRMFQAVAGTWLEAFMPLDSIRAWVGEFSAEMLHPPFLQTIGGAGYCNGMLLYSVTKALQPPAIVESGIFRGFSTWVLSKAAPNAAMHCFDIDFSHIAYRSPIAVYHKNDWTETKLDLPIGTLASFDDHINHARRIEEAHIRGVKRVIFDDDISLTGAYADIPALVPTTAMLADPMLDQIERVEWSVGERAFSVSLDLGEVQRARALIVDRVPLPSLHVETMLPSSPACAVLLS